MLFARALAVVSITFALFSGLTVEKSAANTPDCPTYWNIDQSSPLGEQQLKDAKARLGINMALDGGLISYKNPSGELGPMKSVPPTLSSNDAYLYGDSLVQVWYKVQVQGCSPAVSNYAITLGTLKSRNNIGEFIEGPVLEDWVMANQNRFSDFTKVRDFPKCFEALLSKYLEPGRADVTYKDRKLQLRVTDGKGFITNGRLPLNQCGLISSGTLPGLSIIELTPNCLWRIDSPSLIYGFSIPLGKKCEYAIITGQASSTSGVADIVLLKRFTIDANKWRVSIRCTNGERTRTISGLYDPDSKLQCPKGFRLIRNS